MTIYAVSDASEFKDDNLETDSNTLIFLILYSSHDHNEDLRHRIEKLSNSPEFAEVKFHEHKVHDDDSELAMEYHVKHFPTCLYLKGGQVVDMVVMPKDEKDVVEKLARNK
ncbi:hypothetical protein H2198_005912 [Neophaeococcomyces mojaviensis]|uniref:Uncharacterized protein n=1 Tax=Neophaeococcomyces mojaviensis TaxID=3383035 RepID=A0ACC3A4A2_9EURO|nr:hypothetical protein H2198_005912 [Knufia sp. JES_112]